VRGSVRRSSQASTTVALDAAGIALLLAGAGWAAISAALAGGSALPVAGVYLLTAVSFALGRVVSAGARWVIPVAVAGGIVAVAWVYRADLSNGGPLSGPLGYSNASAALYLQGTIAGLMLWKGGPNPPMRVLGLVLAGITGVATVSTGSQAANVLLLFSLLPVIRPIGRRVHGVIGASAAVLVSALLVSVLLGVAYQPASSGSGLDEVVADTLSGRRPALWHDALTQLSRRPLTGVGPGRFQFESPVARSDRDARWAHNGFLQQGAEGGVVGLAIILAIFAWGFVRLWVNPRPDAVSALGALSLATFGVQACIDYLFHFMALPIVVAALLGVAATPAPRASSQLIEEDDAGRHVRA
jgi:O-antigen ligase